MNKIQNERQNPTTKGNIISHSRKWQESELQIWKVTSGVLQHAMCGDDYLKMMGEALLDKFDKYWDSNSEGEGNENSRKNKKKEKNNVMVIATILDPRFKMKLVDYCFKKMYGKEKGSSEAEEIKSEFFDLYATYEMECMT